MEPVNTAALKEWAVICAALRAGRQVTLLRKGGIHEVGGRFKVEHSAFWLYPTRFHQTTDQLQPGAVDLLDSLHTPPAGQIPFSLYARAEDVYRIDREELLTKLTSHNVLADEVIRQRFHYRQPGLFVLVLRVYELPEVEWLPELPRYEGCKSWVELEQELSTAKLQPILSDEEFQRQREEIRESLAG